MSEELLACLLPTLGYVGLWFIPSRGQCWPSEVSEGPKAWDMILPAADSFCDWVMLGILGTFQRV